MSLHDLATASGVSVATIWRTEQEQTTPTKPNLLMISAVLDIPLGDLEKERPAAIPGAQVSADTEPTYEKD